MKYRMPKERLSKIIYDYIDEEMKEDNLDWRYADDPDFDESYDDTIKEFFGAKFEMGEEDEPYFIYVEKEYYERMEDFSDLKRRFLSKSPILEVRTTQFTKKLDGMFDDLWFLVFQKWFKETFPECPVKTFLYMHREN